MTALAAHHVAAGFEPVREAFRAADFGNAGGAFAAYVDGELVVDLWGGTWQRDTLGVMMSATKGLATVCAQLLVDDGRLDVDARVADYWPEFGKPDVLVRHVLTHTSGVVGLGRPPLPVRWDGTGWDDRAAIAAALEAAPAMWEPGERLGYHAVTYGWLIGELVWRITGQSLGSFFAQRVAAPLELDAWIGVPDSERHRVARVEDRLARTLAPPLRAAFVLGRRRLRDPGTISGQAMLASEGTCLLEAFGPMVNDSPVLASELPFGGGVATARSLARLYASLESLLSTEVIDSFRQVHVAAPDQMLLDLAPRPLRRFVKDPVRRGFGFLINPNAPGAKPLFGPNPAAYGHDGAGGQLGFCDPDARVGVGLVRSDLSSDPSLSLALVDALYRCLHDH